MMTDLTQEELKEILHHENQKLVNLHGMNIGIIVHIMAIGLVHIVIVI